MIYYFEKFCIKWLKFLFRYIKKNKEKKDRDNKIIESKILRFFKIKFLFNFSCHVNFSYPIKIREENIIFYI